MGPARHPEGVGQRLFNVPGVLGILVGPFCSGHIRSFLCEGLEWSDITRAQDQT